MPRIDDQGDWIRPTPTLPPPTKPPASPPPPVPTPTAPNPALDPAIATAISARAQPPAIPPPSSPTLPPPPPPPLDPAIQRAIDQAAIVATQPPHLIDPGIQAAINAHLVNPTPTPTPGMPTPAPPPTSLASPSLPPAGVTPDLGQLSVRGKLWYYQLLRQGASPAEAFADAFTLDQDGFRYPVAPPPIPTLDPKIYTPTVHPAEPGSEPPVPRDRYTLLEANGQAALARAMTYGATWYPPDDNRHEPFAAMVDMGWVTVAAEPWCAVFVSAMFKLSGHGFGPGGNGSASTATIWQKYVVDKHKIPGGSEPPDGNAPAGLPTPGAVIIFSGSTGTYAHIGIVTRASGVNNSFTISYISGNTYTTSSNKQGVFVETITSKTASSVEGWGYIDPSRH